MSSQLKSCYDSQAKQFHHSRAFHRRPELQHVQSILEKEVKNREISGEGASKISLLDLGCGTGRIGGRLDQEKLTKHISYTGVDFSAGMIAQAREHYPHHSYHTQDMTSYLQSQPQQSVDIILCIASFHHLDSVHDRLLALHNMYRTLNYGGTIIMVNRALSDRFISKYKKAIITSGLKTICTLGYHPRNDLMIPRKEVSPSGERKVHRRYYHLFTISELDKLLSLTDFSLDELLFITQAGEKTLQRRDSRNSWCVLRK